MAWCSRRSRGSPSSTGGSATSTPSTAGAGPVIPASAISEDAAHSGLQARPATAEDAGAVAAVDRALTASAGLTCPRDAAFWRYELTGRRAGNVVRREAAVLVTDAGAVVGYVVHGVRPTPAGEVVVLGATCTAEEGWPQAAPAMLAYLAGFGRRSGQESGRPFTGVRLRLGAAHPLGRFAPPGVPQRPDTWYVRTGDPVALLDRWRPAIAARWRAAGLRWPGDSLLIDTYGRAIRLEFRDGVLAAVVPGPRSAMPADDPAVHAAIPPGALLQLALGHRTLPEVVDAWPDCLIRDRDTELFLEAAFPHGSCR